jgi:hypothetical protein
MAPNSNLLPTVIAPCGVPIDMDEGGRGSLEPTEQTSASRVKTRAGFGAVPGLRDGLPADPEAVTP